jgi:hypothetical protein
VNLVLDSLAAARVARVRVLLFPIEFQLHCRFVLHRDFPLADKSGVASVAGSIVRATRSFLSQPDFCVARFSRSGYIFQFSFTYFGFPAPFRYFGFLFTYFGFLFTHFISSFRISVLHRPVTTLDSFQLVLGCRFQFFVSARVRALSSFPHCCVPQIRAVSSKVLVFLRPGLDYRSTFATGLFYCSRLWVLFSSSPCLPARW